MKATLLLAALAGARAFASTSSLQWAVLLDCGSSGTRAHIYSFHITDSWPTTFTPPTSDDQDALKTEPGISSLPLNVTVFADYLQPILEQAARWVPVDKQPTSQLYAFATAGMRLLTAAEQTMRWKAMADALDLVSPFPYERKNLRTIQGIQEGIYGWEDVNQQLRSPPTRTMGWLDLGGASTQIAFVPALFPDVILESQIDGLVEGEMVSAYSHSYMRMGQDQARLSHALGLAVLATAANGGVTPDIVYNPCLPVGYSETLEFCSAGACKPLSFAGIGDFAKCKEGTDALVLKSNDLCLQRPCAVNGRYQPEADGVEFFAASSFYYTLTDLGIIDCCSSSWQGTWGELKALLESYGPQNCATEWQCIGDKCHKSNNATQDLSDNPDYDPSLEDLKRFARLQATVDPTVHQIEFEAMGCFQSAYVQSLLTAYAFLDTTKIHVASEIAGVEVGWTSGALAANLPANAGVCQ